MQSSCSRCGINSDLPSDLHCRKVFVAHLEELLVKHELEAAQRFIAQSTGDPAWDKWWAEVSSTKFTKLQEELLKQQSSAEAEVEDTVAELLSPLKEFLKAGAYRRVEIMALSGQWKYLDMPIWKCYENSLRTEIPREARVPIQYTHRRDWLDFKHRWGRYNIPYLVHLTKRQNLQSIFRMNGLMSRSALQAIGCQPKFASSESSRGIDDWKGIQDYIHTSVQQSPMMYAHDDLVELRIDPRFIYAEETRFSQVNSADTAAMIGSSFKHFNAINLNIATRTWETEDEKKLFQAEILVRHHIPIEFILNRKDIYG